MAPRRPHRHRPITLATVAGAASLALPGLSLFRLYKSTGSLVPVIYTGCLSGAAFVSYGYDKMQARHQDWRVKETTLHMFAILGGWPGALAGMHFFQHKTRKTAFQVPFWAIVLGWQYVWWALWTSDTLPEAINMNWESRY